MKPSAPVAIAASHPLWLVQQTETSTDHDEAERRSAERRLEPAQQKRALHLLTDPAGNDDDHAEPEDVHGTPQQAFERTERDVVRPRKQLAGQSTVTPTPRKSAGTSRIPSLVSGPPSTSPEDEIAEPFPSGMHQHGDDGDEDDGVGEGEGDKRSGPQASVRAKGREAGDGRASDR